METQTDLQRRFNNTKTLLTEQWADNGITIPPTDKEVWGQMKAVARQNQDEAIIDDMQNFVDMYQERIELIDKELEAIHINEQAEQCKVITQYQNGMRHY